MTGVIYNDVPFAQCSATTSAFVGDGDGNDLEIRVDNPREKLFACRLSGPSRWRGLPDSRVGEVDVHRLAGLGIDQGDAQRGQLLLQLVPQAHRDQVVAAGHDAQGLLVVIGDEVGDQEAHRAALGDLGEVLQADLEVGALALGLIGEHVADHRSTCLRPFLGGT